MSEVETVSNQAIPEPEDTGVLSTQTESSGNVVIVPPEESAPKYTLLSDTVMDFGGRGLTRVHLRLLAYGARQMEEQIRDLRAERNRLAQELANARETQHIAERLADRLDERIRGLMSSGRTTGFAQTIGGIVLGAGIQQLMTQPNAQGWAAAVLGTLLVISGWLPRLSPKSEGPKTK